MKKKKLKSHNSNSNNNLRSQHNQIIPIKYCSPFSGICFIQLYWYLYAGWIHSVSISHFTTLVYHMRSFIKVNCSSTHRYTCSPSFFYICSHEIQSNITCTIIKKKERRSNNQSVTLFFPVSKSWVLRTYGFVWLCVAASECVLYRK